jgi:hypothetical protein
VKPHCHRVEDRVLFEANPLDPLRRLVLPSLLPIYLARGWRDTGTFHSIESLAQPLHVLVRDEPDPQELAAGLCRPLPTAEEIVS